MEKTKERHLYTIYFQDGVNFKESEPHRSYEIEFIRLLYAEYAARGYTSYQLYKDGKLFKHGLMIEEELEI